ncbi:MAG: hypothetical protein ABI831_08605 [Betaproteobacteria bacterium]
MIESKPYMWLIGGAIFIGVLILCIIATAAIQGSQQFPTSKEELVKFHSDQCERPQSLSSVVERENTWSNLAYLLAGLLILLRARSIPAILFGANLCALALFSGLYHATLRELPQVMDVAWVYCALFAAVVFSIYTLARLNNSDPPWWVWVGLVVGLDIFGLAIKRLLHWDSTVVFIVLVGLLAIIFASVVVYSAVNGKIASQFGGYYGWLYLLLELVGVGIVAGFGFMFRLGDGYDVMGKVVTEKFLCHPDSIFQAHAAWHILSAAALLLTYDIFCQFQKGSNVSRYDQTTVLPDLS